MILLTFPRREYENLMNLLNKLIVELVSWTGVRAIAITDLGLSVAKVITAHDG
jgi:hypothetical protein